MLAIGDKGFLAAEAVHIAIARGFGFNRLQIGAGSGFRHCQRPDQFTRDHFGQQTGFLFLGAIGQNIMRNDARMNAVTPAG